MVVAAVVAALHHRSAAELAAPDDEGVFEQASHLQILEKGPNGPVGNFSLIQIAESQVSYVLQLIGQIRAGACREIAVSPAATADFEAARAEAAKKSIWATGCKSWYLDKHGVPASWPWTPSRFFEEMASPHLEVYEQAG